MITRFAPSPTGPLHLGHAYSALIAFERAKAENGTFLLRIEDIDQSRARDRWEQQIFDDLTWLGLYWPVPVMRQSERLQVYQDILTRLWDMGLLYPCHCNRKDIQEASVAPQEGAPLHGPDGIIYPGSCRTLAKPDAMPNGEALRLDIAKAANAAGQLSFTETGPEYEGLHQITAAHLINRIGDVVLARRDMGTSYHLSVVVDDAAQGITEVIRGADLFEATAIHVLLQKLLDLPTPTYHHHPLIRDDTGKRLAKRDDARAIATYRQSGSSAQDIRALVGL